MNRQESEAEINQILTEIENKLEHEYWADIRDQYKNDPEFQENIEIMKNVYNQIMQSAKAA